MGPGPFCVGSAPTLGDCALAPTTAMVRKILAAGQFGIADPTQGPRLKTWWKAVEGNADCSSVLASHAEAFDAFMKQMAARR